MKYVLGVDLGTSAVKISLVSQEGKVCHEVSKSYPLIHEKTGYSEQDPEAWVSETLAGLKEMADTSGVPAADIEGMSFSGQMHGLVLLDSERKVLRPAILWNDTRTTSECEQIRETLGDSLNAIAKNPALEGFTLPKILWVQKHEPQRWNKADVFMLPKDYLRYRLTGNIHMEYSDAAGTLMLDIAKKEWSSAICEAFGIASSVCPPLVDSHAMVGTLLPELAEKTGLNSELKVFAGGADNACAAIGSGILSDGRTLCSTGTSGVVLSYEKDGSQDYAGRVHFFNHGKSEAFYLMGVTLAAGYSLSWFKDTFAENESFDEMLKDVGGIEPGAGGLLFTPYIVGERTPHADAKIRGSFIGMDSSHRKSHFARAVMEGITFSLRESLEIFRSAGKKITSIVSVGGGAKNDVWLQMQADIFDAEIVKLKNEQGPAMGAAMLAAYGCGWFSSLEDCADVFIETAQTFKPNPDAVQKYNDLFKVYEQVYSATKPLNDSLMSFRK